MTFFYFSCGITLFTVFFVLTVAIIVGRLVSNPFVYFYFIIASSLVLGLYLDYRVYNTLRDNGYVPCEDLVGFDPLEPGTTYGRSIEACLSAATPSNASPHTGQLNSPVTDTVD